MWTISIQFTRPSDKTNSFNKRHVKARKSKLYQLPKNGFKGIGKTCFTDFDTPQNAPNQELILCVAKSWKWYQALSKGKVRSVQELAALEKTSVETITRNLPLAVLKPGQVEKLLKGQHTPDLSVAQLLKAPSLL